MYKAKKFDEAKAAYSMAIELNPEDLIYYTNLAAVHIEEKNFDLAVAECDKAIAKSKEGIYDFVKLGKAMARKANALAGKGDYVGAIASYKSALIEHNDVHHRDALKRIEKKKKDEEAAAYLNPELSE